MAQDLGVAPRPVDRSVSLYPASTRHDLALLISAVAIFFVACRLFAKPRSAIALLGVLAFNAAALAFFGLVQQLQWNGQLFGTVPLTEGGAPFASFVNRNSGAGYLNIGLGCAIGLTVWVFSGGSDGAGAEVSRRRDRTDLASLIAELNVFKLAAVALTSVIFAGVACSLSRGGWISAAVAAATTLIVVLVIKRISVSATIWAVIVLLGFALVAWVGRTDLVGARFSSLWQNAGRVDSRLGHWQNGWQAAQCFPVLGSGLGTYRYVYRLYEEQPSQSWFYHAENQYLEALVEGGIPGLLLMWAAVLLVTINCRHLVAAEQPAAFACGVAGAFVLISQAVHALFDFGLYMPANMAALALVCGSVCGFATRHFAASRTGRRRSRSGTVEGSRTTSLWLALPRWHGVPVSLTWVLVLATAWGASEIRRTEASETLLRASRFEQRPGAIEPAVLDGLLAELGSLSARQTDNAELYERLGQLWVLRYRLQAFGELSQQPRHLEAEEDFLWGLTSSINLHRRTHELLRDGPETDLSQLRRARDVQLNLHNACRALIAARRTSPLLVRPHLMLAELGRLVSESVDDRPSLARAVQLVRGNHGHLLECGLLAAQAGDIDQACVLWRRALEVLPDQYWLVLDVAAQAPAIEGRLAEVFPDSPRLLVKVAREHFVGEDQRALRVELARRASGLLDVADRLPAAERSYLQGVALALAERPDAGLEHYQRAVSARPDCVSWRFEMARLMESVGRLAEAEEHAARCAGMEPENEEYSEFQRQLVLRRLGG